MGTEPLWLRLIGAFFVPPLRLAHLLTQNRSYRTACQVGLLLSVLWQLAWAAVILTAVFLWA